MFSLRPLHLLIFALFTVPQVLAQTEVYKWTNKDGVTVFSDIPKENSVAIQVTKAITIASSIKPLTPLALPEAKSELYHIEITQPTDHQTIRDNNGSVTVAVQVPPQLPPRINISLLLDGKTYITTENLANLSLKNVDRGEHQLKVNIINDKGKVIASSKSVTFYMHRTSVISAN